MGGLVLSGCDRFPYVIIENDTASTVVAVADDFGRDTETIAPNQAVDMSPLPKRQDTLYRFMRPTGEAVGCVTARFKGKDRTALVKVSAATPCAPPSAQP